MPLRILSAGSTLHGLKACAAIAEQAIGVPLHISTDHGHNIRDAILRGDAAADVALIPADMAVALAARLSPDGAVLLGTVGIGGVVRRGAAAPGIATLPALRDALMAADAIYLTRAPTGDHLRAAIARLGLHDAVAPKLQMFDTATKLNAALAASSGAALGFGPETEIRAAANGVTWIGDVPPEIQIALRYKAVMLAGAAPLAREFLRFLATPAARAAFTKSGVCQ